MINLETLKDHEMMPLIINKSGNNAYLYAIILIEILLLGSITFYLIQFNKTQYDKQ